jgi:hypothetical protein
MNNKNIIYKLQTIQFNRIDAMWVPGHEGIALNEMADTFAKTGAANQTKERRPFERKIVLINLKHQVLSNWQRRVDHELANHQITEINKDVNSWQLHNNKGSKHLMRLATGHHFLNTFQSKLNCNIGKNCSCGHPETLHHYLFFCQKFIRFRLKWRHQVVGITEDLNVLKVMSLTTVFGQRTDLSDEKNRQLQRSTCDYIIATNRFK